MVKLWKTWQTKRRKWLKYQKSPNETGWNLEKSCSIKWKEANKENNLEKKSQIPAEQKKGPVIYIRNSVNLKPNISQVCALVNYVCLIAIPLFPKDKLKIIWWYHNICYHSYNTYISSDLVHKFILKILPNLSNQYVHKNWNVVILCRYNDVKYLGK